MLVLGLFIGALATIAGMGALRQGTPYNDAIMAVMKHQLSAVRAIHESGKCDADQVRQRFDFLAATASHIDEAFLPVGDDDRFRELSGNLNKAVAVARSLPLATCPELKQAMDDVGKQCKSCHDVFR
jgi:cytochrome c556